MSKFTKAIAAIMLIAVVIVAAGCTKPDGPNNPNNGGGGSTGGGGYNGGGGGGNGTYNGHDYVDLGLPSGTLWATCNVGASSPEGYGDYFAWGETQPKSTYNWSNYQHGNYNTLTKYCTDSRWGYNGYVDNQTILQPMDDAVTANWGDGWRMPTKAELDELIDKTDNVWTICNGKYGRLFKGNGNTLFLPAAGAGDSKEGVFGCYWSSSLYTEIPEFACTSYSFHSDGCFIVNGYTSRSYGYPVRAVRSH